jgi:hypothetical protein
MAAGPVNPLTKGRLYNLVRVLVFVFNASPAEFRITKRRPPGYALLNVRKSNPNAEGLMLVSIIRLGSPGNRHLLSYCAFKMTLELR